MSRPYRAAPRWETLTAILLAVLVSLAVGRPAQALPMYAHRSGRTCGNCHVSPTLEDEKGWENPALMDRKCTLSCVSCHVDPAGGGLRNSSGRYFGQSTLGIAPTQDRSYSDLGRELLSDEQIWRIKQFLGKPMKGEEGTRIPDGPEELAAGEGAGQTGNAVVWGHAAGEVPTMGFWDGRYDDLNADPMFQLGGDFRAGWWSTTGQLFPMQMDLHGAFHPVHRLSLVGTVSGRSPDGPGEGPVFARRAFVMAHELPGMSWAKAGIFMPAFGNHTDDHTTPVRALFEQDVSDAQDTVIGVEVGTAPNYPWASVSVFSNDTSFINGGALDPGWGSAVTLGWRDLGWTLGGHGMVKRRGGMGRGDLMGGGVIWAFNPAAYWEKLPVTLQGEVSGGRRDQGADRTRFAASTAELGWIVRNGVNLRLQHDIAWHDLDRAQGPEQRWSAGFDLSPVPGITLGPRVRARSDPGGGAWNADTFVQLHAWF